MSVIAQQYPYGASPMGSSHFPSSRTYTPHQYTSTFGHSTGVGPQGAQYWHHRAYGRLEREIERMTPEEIGQAAAYEAYRQWNQNRAGYGHVDSEIGRAELIGLAVAESTKLVQYLPHTTDFSISTIASESAVSYASMLYDQNRGIPMSSGTGSYQDSSWSPSDDGYTSDYHHWPRRRSYHRTRSSSLPPPIQYATSGGYSHGHGGYGSYGGYEYPGSYNSTHSSMQPRSYPSYHGASTSMVSTQPTYTSAPVSSLGQMFGLRRPHRKHHRHHHYPHHHHGHHHHHSRRY